MSQIELELSPSSLRERVSTELTVTLRNTGPGMCTRVVVRLAMPNGVLRVRGSLHLQTDQLDVDERRQCRITVEAQRPGVFQLDVVNFSYQDPGGRSRRPVGRALPFEVLAQPMSEPEPILVSGPVRRRGSVFISYRREDTEERADQLYGELCRAFGAGNVFLDRQQRRPGDFRTRLHAGLGSSTAMLVLIGPRWNSHLLAHDDDYVRYEIRTAIAAGAVLIPVLSRRAEMPDAEELPADIRRFAFQECFEIRGTSVPADTRAIIDALRPFVAERNHGE